MTKFFFFFFFFFFIKNNIIKLIFFELGFLFKDFFLRKMLDLQHQYNNGTITPHIRVGSIYWDPLSCEELL
jgi:hypothetical protein